MTATDPTPTVLVLVEDTVAALSSLLLAADIAAMQGAHLHVLHVAAPSPWLAVAPLAIPAVLLDDLSSAASVLLQNKVASLLDAAGPVRWTFAAQAGDSHAIAEQTIQLLRPLAVVVGAPRRYRPRLRRPLARWLIGRPNMPAVVAPS